MQRPWYPLQFCWSCCEFEIWVVSDVTLILINDAPDLVQVIAFVFIFRYFRSLECLLSMLIILTYPFISLHKIPAESTKNTTQIHTTQPENLHQETNLPVVQIRLYQYHIAAVGILFTWIVNMIHISENPHLGGYVEMLVKVSFNFMKFFFACISLLIAFACSFSILFPRESSMENMLSSPLKELLNSHISNYRITNLINIKMDCITVFWTGMRQSPVTI